MCRDALNQMIVPQFIHTPNFLYQTSACVCLRIFKVRKAYILWGPFDSCPDLLGQGNILCVISPNSHSTL